MMHIDPRLEFVVCVSDQAILNQYFLASPCIQEKRYPVSIIFNQPSAGAAYNQPCTHQAAERSATWRIWVHQDVYLPAGWDSQFIQSLKEAQIRFPLLRVAGVYGVAGHAPQTIRAGKILDRGHVLHEAIALPCLVDSLDELLIATRADAQLSFDPALGFDFYGTDIVLSAQAQGYTAAVIEAPCEHWSSTPQNPPFPAALKQRIVQSALAFENKWRSKLPLATPCFEIDQIGATARFFEIQRHD